MLRQACLFQVDVTISSINNTECIKCSRDIKICTDTVIDNVINKKYDAVILPGGVGWKNLASV